MVTVILIAYRRGEGQSSGSLTDFIPHPTGRLNMENALSLGAGFSSLGAWALSLGA